MKLRRAEDDLDRHQTLEIGADIQLLGDTHAAVQLHRLLRDKSRRPADLHLGGRRGARPRRRIGVGHQHGIERARARLLDLDGHRRHAMPQHLIVRQRLAELDALSGVGDGRLEQHLHAAGRLRRHRRDGVIHHLLDRGQRIRIVAEQRAGRHCDLDKLDIAGAAAIQGWIGRDGQPFGRRGDGEHADARPLTLVAGDTRGDQQCVRPGRTEHDILAPGDVPALVRARRHGRDIFERKARLRLGMGECEQRLAFGNRWQQLGFLLLRAELGDQPRGNHRGRQIRLDHQRAAERLHDDAGFDGARTEAAILFRDREPEPAEIGELAPDLAAEPFARLQDGAARFERIATGDEPASSLTQQPLFFGKREIH